MSRETLGSIHLGLGLGFIFHAYYVPEVTFVSLKYECHTGMEGHLYIYLKTLLYIYLKTLYLYLKTLWRASVQQIQ